MNERRRSRRLHVADDGCGYIRFVEPRYITQLWYMLSDDNAPFLPIVFR